MFTCIYIPKTQMKRRLWESDDSDEEELYRNYEKRRNTSTDSPVVRHTSKRKQFERGDTLRPPLHYKRQRGRKASSRRIDDASPMDFKISSDEPMSPDFHHDVLIDGEPYIKLSVYLNEKEKWDNEKSELVDIIQHLHDQLDVQPKVRSVPSIYG